MSGIVTAVSQLAAQDFEKMPGCHDASMIGDENPLDVHKTSFSQPSPTITLSVGFSLVKLIDVSQFVGKSFLGRQSGIIQDPAVDDIDHSVRSDVVIYGSTARNNSSVLTTRGARPWSTTYWASASKAGRLDPTP